MKFSVLMDAVYHNRNFMEGLSSRSIPLWIIRTPISTIRQKHSR